MTARETQAIAKVRAARAARDAVRAAFLRAKFVRGVLLPPFLLARAEDFSPLATFFSLADAQIEASRRLGLDPDVPLVVVVQGDPAA